MTFDFSHLYKTETVNLGLIDGKLLSVTVREIPHGEMVEMQRKMLGKLHITKNKREMDDQLKQITFSAPDFSDNKNVAAIVAWTLQDAKGNDVPVGLEAWRALPHSLTEQIEEAIKRLNPDSDEEFQE